MKTWALLLLLCYSAAGGDDKKATNYSHRNDLQRIGLYGDVRTIESCFYLATQVNNAWLTTDTLHFKSIAEYNKDGYETHAQFWSEGELTTKTNYWRVMPSNGKVHYYELKELTDNQYELSIGKYLEDTMYFTEIYDSNKDTAKIEHTSSTFTRFSEMGTVTQHFKIEGGKSIPHLLIGEKESGDTTYIKIVDGGTVDEMSTLVLEKDLNNNPTRTLTLHQGDTSITINKYTYYK